MGAQTTGYFFEWFKAGKGDAGASSIEEFGCPSRRFVGPEVAKCLDQKEGAERAQGTALNGAHVDALRSGPIRSSFQEGPAHLFEQGFEPGLDPGESFLARIVSMASLRFFAMWKGSRIWRALGRLAAAAFR